MSQSDERNDVDPATGEAGLRISEAAEAIRENLLGTPKPIATPLVIRVQELLRLFNDDPYVLDWISEDIAEEAQAISSAMHRTTALDAVSNTLIHLANLLDGIGEEVPRDTPLFAAAAAVAAAYLA